jgi:tRNA modification GTPase
MSGEGCLDILNRIFRGEESPGEVDGRGVYVGRVFEPRMREHIDDVVVVVFRAPKSYTGEDMVEITCHGGRYVPLAVLDACLGGGARIAEAGEFTKRAYLNGKVDLIQAEAVAAMIAASTRRAHRLAADQLGLALSREIEAMRNALLELTSRIEYEIDFPDEGPTESHGILIAAQRVRRRIRALLKTWKEGAVTAEGALVVIAGRPNVGKSSLFNLMSRRVRAIVTPHPGTTRDAIEQEIALSGLRVRLVDTAGLRQTDDEVERIGVEVSRKYLEAADIVLFLVSATEELRAEEVAFLESIGEKDAILIVNKVDLVENRNVKTDPGREAVYLSAETGEGFEELRERIVSVALGDADRQGPAITTLRQRCGLELALGGIERVMEGLRMGTSMEFLAEDLRDAQKALSELIGGVTADDILDTIFTRFCVGK